MKAHWMPKWRSRNLLDGVSEHLIYRDTNTRWLIFDTRRECREYIEEHYSYIRTRNDLQYEPYGWRVPVAVRVSLPKERKP